VTATELYEIVKDHRDVWGNHIHWNGYGFCRRRGELVYNTVLDQEPVENELLGLGVKWLAERRAQPQVIARRDGTYRAHTEHECSLGSVMAFKHTGRGRTVLAAVYAAIAYVKRATKETP
jgi:hypothetical protein